MIEQAIAPLVGMGLSLIGQKGQDRRQIEQQKKLQRLQIEGNKDMAKYSMGLQKNMWDETNYGAQVEHMKNAGLNVGLMYGGSGGGGATTGSGGGAGVSGANATDPSSAQGAMQGMGMMAGQAALMAAQKENIEANTTKTEAETAKLGGADTNKVIADTRNTELDSEWKEIQNNIGKQTQQEIVSQVINQTQKQYGEMKSAMAQGNIDNVTQGEKIKQINTKGVQMLLENNAIRTGTRLNEAQIEKTANDIVVALDQLNVQREGQVVSKENMAELTEAMLWSAGINATGNLVNSILEVRSGKFLSPNVKDAKHNEKVINKQWNKPVPQIPQFPKLRK